MLLELVVAVLESIEAPYAVIGGQAVAMRGHPRLTVDYDFLTTDHRVFDRQVWRTIEDTDAVVDIRKGDSDDPLAGVVRMKLANERDVDVVVAKSAWERGVIERAERLPLLGVRVPVPRTSDLILLKVAAGGYVDLQDVYALLHAGDRDQLIADVESVIGALPPDAQASWKRIVDASR
jgi:hypothetical protein